VTGKPHVLLLGGSHAEPSHTSALMRAMERTLAVRGATTCRWDLATQPLPALVPSDRDPGRALVQVAHEADAVVIGSPLYHGSFSGAVKDALDHLSARELEGKAVALVSHSGSFPSTQALDHLRGVARALGCLALPRQLVTVDADYSSVEERFVLASEEISTRMDALADDLLALARRLRASVLIKEPRRAPELVGSIRGGDDG
jgi:azobenzene reductase